MTDRFTAELEQLLHIAREQIDRIDNGTAHMQALAERFKLLAAAIEDVDQSQEDAMQRMSALLLRYRPIDHDRINGVVASMNGTDRRLAS